MNAPGGIAEDQQVRVYRDLLFRRMTQPFNKFEVRFDPQFEQFGLQTLSLDGYVKLAEGLASLWSQPILGHLAHEVSIGTQDVHQSQRRFKQSGLILFRQQRDEFVADSVPLPIVTCVRGIFPEKNAFLSRVIRQLVLRLPEQGPNQSNPGIAGRGIAPFHPGQPASSTAAEQAQEKMFHLVVRVMSHGNRVNSKLAPRRGQKIVP